MSYGKIQKLMRKTCRSKGRNADFYVIEISHEAEQPAEFTTETSLLLNNVKSSGRYSTMTSRSYCR
jgi:hypothetical protein